MSIEPPAGAPRASGPTTWWPVLALGALAVVTWKRPLPASAGPSATPSDRTTPAAPARGDPADGHGRGADTPLDIPIRGWKDILFRVYDEIGNDRLLAVAAGVTFYALLAIFPAIAALVSLYGLFSDAGSIAKQLDGLSGVLPGGAVDIIGEQVKRIASKPNSSLSFALVASLGISLWSANAGMKAIFDALNVAYNETEKRSFVVLNLTSLAFTFGAILILILAMVSAVVVPVIFNTFGIGGLAATLLALARWPVLLAIIVTGFSVLYRFGPSRAHAKWRWITWGSGLAAISWVLASVLFSIYVSSFGSYNATYGSLGAAVGFMTWIWISSIILLLGAEICSEMEHQTERDTTTGPERPMGSRHARMADEIGEERT